MAPSRYGPLSQCLAVLHVVEVLQWSGDVVRKCQARVEHGDLIICTCISTLSHDEDMAGKT